MSWIRIAAVGMTAALITSGVANAWGPRAQVSIVTTGIRVIDKETNVRLNKLSKDVESGASLSGPELESVLPLALNDPLGAIESEMYLLEAVRGDRIDPYYAYRLGMLGGLVAQATSPLSGASPTYRNLYFADVDANIEQARIKQTPRATVDPKTYFAEAKASAAANENLIINDYKSGLGFKGVAGASLSESASRSVNAVADTLLTVIKGRSSAASISTAQLRDYALKSIEFYVIRGNDTEADSSYKRLQDLHVLTPDLQKQIGDMFYDAGKYERAMQEYQSVLAASPGQRDVSERIATYYVKVGDEALNADNLDVALANYQKAAEADKLHSTAQEKLISAQKLVKDRDTRHDAAKQAVADAESNVSRAEQASMQRDYGQAMAMLVKAQDLYQGVTEEFRQESQKAQAGLLTVRTRLSQLQQELVSNAPALSGKGESGTTRKIAHDAAKDQQEAALRALLDAKFVGEVERLQTERSNDFKP